MADPGASQDNNWPLPKFYFSVQLGEDEGVTFQEVSGLQTESKPIEYRHGNSKIFAPIKMPGMFSVGNVTLKKGIFIGDTKFFAWFSEIKMNLIKRRTVVINLIDEAGKAKISWTLNNAFPTKVTGTDLKSTGNEVAVESIELAFETLDIKAVA
jgi:phage tail-like protein